MKQTIFYLFLLSILAGNDPELYAASSESIPCSSISSIDLQNATINKIKFVAGEACTSDSAELPDQCDWEHEISSDEILRPISGKEVRLAILHSNHKTGSGAYDTVFVFDCLNGSMRNIFENKYLYGVKIKKYTEGEFILTSGDWQLKDPMCCPSKEKHETYRWSSRKNTFMLESTTSSK